MKKLFAFLILVLLGFGIYFFSSYGFQEPAAELTERTTILRIGYSEWPPDLIVYLAQEKGFFEANGLQVELVPVDGFEDLFEKIENKQIDLWPVTLLDAVIAYSEGEEWQIIALEDYSNGADAVLTMEDSGIEGISGLTGKKVGTEQGTVGEFFLQILLQRDGLELSDVEIVDMSYDQIPAALVSGEIDAGVTYEPSITETLNQGGRVLTDSASERGTIVDVYSAYRSHLEAYPESYKKFVLSLLDAADYYNAHPEESISIMAEAYGNDVEELSKAFEKLKIPNLRENQTAFKRTSGFESLFNLAKQAELYLVDQGVVQKTSDLTLLFSDLVDDL